MFSTEIADQFIEDKLPDGCVPCYVEIAFLKWLFFQKLSCMCSLLYWFFFLFRLLGILKLKERGGGGKLKLDRDEHLLFRRIRSSCKEGGKLKLVRDEHLLFRRIRASCKEVFPSVKSLANILSKFLQSNLKFCTKVVDQQYNLLFPHSASTDPILHFISLIFFSWSKI